MKGRLFYQFLKDNPTLAWIFIFSISFLLIYAIIKSVNNKSYRKDFIEFCLSTIIPVIILCLYIVPLVYIVIHFDLIENNKLFSVLLYLVTAGAIVISFKKKMDDLSFKSLKYPLVFISIIFVVIQAFLFIERNYTERYFKYGKNKYLNEQYLEAIKDFETYIDYRNNIDSAHYYKIKCLIKLKKFDEANLDYKKSKIKNFDYRREMFAELLKCANSFIIDTISWKEIDERYKDTLSINLGKANFFIDTINMKIQLKEFKYLDKEWKEFRKTSIFIARNNITNLFSKREIASEKDFIIFITLLSFEENKKFKEIIDKYFQLNEKHLNTLFTRALLQEYLLYSHQFMHSSNLESDIEEFKSKYFKKDTSP
jgi:hypothetical protein